MKKISIALASLLSLPALVGTAQTYPLSENRWSNPEFVDRFMGTYGVVTDLEPKVTSAEAEVLQQVGTALQADNPQQAIQVLRSAITAESSGALNYTLGSLLLQQGQNEPAVQQYEAAIKKFPNFRRAYKNMGLAFIQQGAFDKAREYLIKAIELGDNEGNTFGLLGYAYLNLENPSAALDAYELASVLAPNNRDWKVGLATTLQQTGEFRKAISKFRELVDQEPSKRSYYIAMANAHLSLSEPAEAAAILELVRRLGDADASILMLLGDIYVNQNLAELAANLYTDAVETGNAPAEKVARFAGALVQRQQYDLALQMIDATRDQMGARLSDEVTDDLLNLEAQIRLAQGRGGEAVEILEELVDRDPLNGRALLLLADHYARESNYETAEFYFERAEKVPDVAPEAYVDHARMQVGRKEFGDAVRLLERAQALRPRANVADYLKAVRDAYQASL